MQLLVQRPVAIVSRLARGSANAARITSGLTGRLAISNFALRKLIECRSRSIIRWTFPRIPQRPPQGRNAASCLDRLTDAPTTTLQCTHVFHAAYVSELRKLGIKQTCPLCRTLCYQAPNYSTRMQPVVTPCFAN